jgi:hypothetical protein
MNRDQIRARLLDVYAGLEDAAHAVRESAEHQSIDPARMLDTTGRPALADILVAQANVLLALERL